MVDLFDTSILTGQPLRLGPKQYGAPVPPSGRSVGNKLTVLEQAELNLKKAQIAKTTIESAKAGIMVVATGTGVGLAAYNHYASPSISGVG